MQLSYLITKYILLVSLLLKMCFFLYINSNVEANPHYFVLYQINLSQFEFHQNLRI